MINSLILLSAQEANILPLTSACNVQCVFCSHKQNPEDIHVFSIPPRSIEEIEETLDFMTPDKKIVIGESVTKINEGEPFTHPKVKKILSLIRQRFPKTVVQITTNGTLLDEELVAFLAALGNVEINLSLNSYCPENRVVLMKDKRAQQAVESAKLLMSYDIPFHGSVVAMPFVTGWEDLKATIRYLDANLARTIRVFLPGYTKLATKELVFREELWQQIANVLDEMRKEIKTPITCEPQKILTLDAIVEGVIHRSSAYGQLRAGDVIVKVNETKVFSRVDAFRRLFEEENPLLEIKRNGYQVQVNLHKAANSAPGLVMSYDMDIETTEDIVKEIIKKKAQKTLVLTSKLAYETMKLSLAKFMQGQRIDDIDVEVGEVKNQFFGGNIMAAGLLVVEDFINFLSFKNLEGVDLVLLPAISFDHKGRDLTGRSYLEIEDKFKFKVSII